MDPIVLAMPLISLDHLDQDTQDRLAAGDAPWCACAVLPGAGVFLYLDELYDGDEAIPQCLIDVQQWLSDWSDKQDPRVNHRWVRLDQDAVTVPGLPVYGDDAEQGSEPANSDTHLVAGRKFTVLARFPNSDEGDRQANQYMEANPGAAVLAVTPENVILASKNDQGAPT